MQSAQTHTKPGRRRARAFRGRTGDRRLRRRRRVGRDRGQLHARAAARAVRRTAVEHRDLPGAEVRAAEGQGRRLPRHRGGLQRPGGQRRPAGRRGRRLEVLQASYNAADPSTFLAALNIAIAKHANYVMEAGTPLSPAFTSAAAAHHIKIAVDAVDPVTLGGPVIDSSGGEPVDYRMGELTADEFIVDSHGKGEAVEEAIPQYPILTTFAHGFQNTVKAHARSARSIWPTSR